MWNNTYTEPQEELPQNLQTHHWTLIGCQSLLGCLSKDQTNCSGYNETKFDVDEVRSRIERFSRESSAAESKQWYIMLVGRPKMKTVMVLLREIGN